jgi:DNA-binding FrmR family transcriptional regulator
MSHGHPHSGHPKIINRLKRAHGHLANVIEMLEAGVPCVDVSQQLQAVEGAVASAKKALIHEHLEHCLLGDARHDDHGATDTVLDELKRITKYL